MLGLGWVRPVCTSTRLVMLGWPGRALAAPESRGCCLVGVCIDRRWVGWRKVAAGQVDRWQVNSGSSWPKGVVEEEGKEREKVREKEKVFDFFDFQVFETQIYNILDFSENFVF